MLAFYIFILLLLVYLNHIKSEKDNFANIKWLVLRAHWSLIGNYAFTPFDNHNPLVSKCNLGTENL